MPRDLLERIRKAIRQLELNRFPPGSRKLVGTTDLYRLRVGDWRIIYTIREEHLIVLIVNVAPRGSAYRDL